MRAWKAIASKIETGGDWDAVFLNFTETLRQQLLQLPQEMQKAFQDSSEPGDSIANRGKGSSSLGPMLRRAPWHVGQASTATVQH